MVTKVIEASVLVLANTKRSFGSYNIHSMAFHGIRYKMVMVTVHGIEMYKQIQSEVFVKVL